MIKKNTILSIVFVSMITFIFSCRNKTENKTIELKFAFYGDVRNKPMGDEIVKAFEEKNPSMKITIIPIVQDYNSKVLTMIAGGDESAPDIMVFGPSLMTELSSKGVLLNLDHYISVDKEFSSFKNNIHASSLEAGKLKGVFYSVPFWTNSYALFYNKTIFDREGVKYPDKTWNLDKLLEVSRQLTKDTNNDGKIDQYGFFDYVYLLDMMYKYIKLDGNELFNKDMSKCFIDTPKVMKTVRWCLDLIVKYKVTPSPLSGDERLRDYEQSFITGKVAMMFSGRWSMSMFYSIKKFEWSVAPFPRGKREYKPCASMLLGAYSKTKYPRECWEFLKFTMNEESQNIVCDKKVDIPVLLSAAKSSQFINKFSRPKENQCFLDALKSSSEYPYHFTKENKWLSYAKDRLLFVIIGKENIESACKEISNEYYKLARIKE